MVPKKMIDDNTARKKKRQKYVRRFLYEPIEIR